MTKSAASALHKSPQPNGVEEAGAATSYAGHLDGNALDRLVAHEIKQLMYEADNIEAIINRRSEPEVGNYVYSLQDVYSLRLLCKSEAKPVHQWLIRRRLGPGRWAQGHTAEDLPWDMYGLATHIALWSPLRAWDAAPAAERRRYVKRVTRLAAQLAAELRAPIRPTIPSAIDLFDHAIIMRARLGPDDEREGRLRELIAGFRSLDAGQPSHQSAYDDIDWKEYLQLQDLAGVLDQLAERIASAEFDARPDARPMAGNANQRHAARHLADWFDEHYGRVPNVLVADLLNLMLPDSNPPADEELVRDWRGVK